MVGKDSSCRRVLIGMKWALVWNAPGTKTIIGLILAGDRSIASTYKNNKPLGSATLCVALKKK